MPRAIDFALPKVDFSQATARIKEESKQLERELPSPRAQHLTAVCARVAGHTGLAPAPELPPAKKLERLERVTRASKELGLDLKRVASARPTWRQKGLGFDAAGERVQAAAAAARALESALNRASFSSAARDFPREALLSLQHTASAAAAAFVEARARRAAGLLEGMSRETPPPVQASAREIAEMLDAPALAKTLVGVAKRSPDAGGFARNLARFAALVEHAVTAPDYFASTGWDQPFARVEHRQRAFGGVVARASLARHERTRQALIEDLQAVVLDQATPARELEARLVHAFMRELDSHSGGDDVTPETVERILSQEYFLPLRALNANIEAISSTEDAAPHAAAVRGVVEEITTHVLRGDFRDWRQQTTASQHQLSTLTPEQRKGWHEDLRTEHVPYPNPGREACVLSTREEDGPELLWTTKIGGPSHGFDFGPRCLLPLLANARTKAIMVEDPRFDDGPSARCYLRVLELESGRPVLYLEPPQRDFVHMERFEDPEEFVEIRASQIAHAQKKSEKLELPLLVQRQDAGLLRWGARRRTISLALAPSGGIFEASDTLDLGHDFVQVDRMVTPPLFLLHPAPAPARLG